LIVSATLLHPLTETRLPTLAHTSALATPVVTGAFDATASSAIPAAIHGRTCLRFMLRPARVVESIGNVP
jgi:hypothetical protein